MADVVTYQPNSLVDYSSVDDLIFDYKRGSRPRLVWSNHALQRFSDMKRQNALLADEVSDAVVSPQLVSKSIKYDSMLLTHTRISLSVCLGGDNLPVVATILWATAEDWQDSYGARPLEGREPREDLGHLRRRQPANDAH